MLEHVSDLLTGGWRYATGLRAFLAVTMSREEAERLLRRQLQNRESSFLDLIEHGVYGNPRSPYLPLLQQAGFEFEHVRSLVEELGLEAALARLYDAGVYVTLDEFKGRAPISRPGLDFAVNDRDFDNPLLTAHYRGRTGGSRGGGTRVDIDFDLVSHDSETLLCGLAATAVIDRPYLVWRAAPPSAHGLRIILRLARQGRTPVRWFASNKPRWNRQGIEGRVLMALTLVLSRLFRRPVPRPRYAKDAAAIVDFLAGATRRGAPALVLCIPSQAVRICLAAQEAGKDISGTAFFGGGEPCTEGKAAVLRRSGARGLPTYGMQETGSVGLPCANPAVSDDMHLLTDKLAVIQRRKHLAEGQDVEEFVYTTLLTSASKVMLNVQSGDYGVLDQRDCACLWHELGFTTHVSHVRSYEKLTSEGVMFTGSMLFELLEGTLPERFGGGPTDFNWSRKKRTG